MDRTGISAVLLTGDEDIRVGVLQAQEYGVRVHLVGIASRPGGDSNQAALLKQESDSVVDLTATEVATFMECVAVAGQPGAPTAAGAPPPAVATYYAVTPLTPEAMDTIVEAALGQMDEASIRQIADAGRYAIPRHLDGLLLTTATTLIGGPVPDAAKKELRGRLVAARQGRTGR